jgi:polysaccharide export outer membrane protein
MSLRWLVIVLVVAGCGDPPASSYPTEPPRIEADATLGPGDVIEIRVFQQEDMSAPYSVSAQGTIAFPLIGNVAIAGKTPAQVETDIRDRLAGGYLRSPQVSVLVKEFNSRKVSVFGQVRKPGTMPYGDGMTIVEAVSQAGGFTGMARRNAVTVTRKREGKEIKYTVPVEKIGEGSAANFYLRPGDVVFVPERWY